MKKPIAKKKPLVPSTPDYSGLVGGIGDLLNRARHASARAVNALMTATYWEIGRRIVEFEQGGKVRADYGEELLQKLSKDLSARFGRGFGFAQVNHMRQFYQTYPNILQSPIVEFNVTPHPAKILQSPIVESRPPANVSVIRQSPIDELPPADRAPENIQSTIEESPSRLPDKLQRLANRLPLAWTHYTRLLRVENPLAREFYETEALRGGWTVRQLERQIGSQFYERTALSRKKTAMLVREYRTALPDEKRLAAEITAARKILEARLA